MPGPSHSETRLVLLWYLSFRINLSTDRKPTFLQTDDGMEFRNSVFQRFLKDNGKRLFTTKSEKKASIVERFNRTLKMKMSKYFTEKNTVHYLDVLPELVFPITLHATGV